MGRTTLRGLDLAGLRVAIEVPSEWADQHPAGRAELESAWPGCRPSDASMHVGVRIAPTESPLQDAFWYRAADATFEVGRCPQTGSRPGDWVVAVYGARGCERVARFDDALCDVDLTIDPVALASLEHPLMQPIDEILLIHQLASSGGALVHGSLGRGDDGGAVLTLCEQRSDGPGTLESAAAARPSERVVIRLDHETQQVWAHPTPWTRSKLSGDRGVGGRVRLEAIRVLESALQPFRESLDLESSCCELLARASAPVHHPEGAERAVSILSGIAARVPVHRIGEPRRAPVVEFDLAQSMAGLAFAPPS